MSEKAIKKEQIKLFKQRLKPVFVMFDEPVSVVRGFKGMKKPVNEAQKEWSDFIRFEPREIKDISVWNAFVEKYSQFLQFQNNPLENKAAFVQELFELYEFLGSNRTVTNHFTITRDSLFKSHGIEVVRNDEKFNSEKYPRTMRCAFELKWIVKA